MKPLKLEVQAFGPYAGYEEIDFADLAKNGLFLICGKTGSGKTCILDAMVIALFDKGSGEENRGLEAMRSNRVLDNVPTFVRFTFEVKGKVYQFERRVEKKKKNFSVSQNVSVLNSEGVFEPIFENPKKSDLVAKAEELTGLTREQFSQVIILPQGQFEALLVAKSEERAPILEKIFGIDKWKKIALKAYEIAVERKNDISGKKENLLRKMEVFDVKDEASLRESIEITEKYLKKAKEEFEEKRYDDKRKVLEEKKEKIPYFNDLADLLEKKRSNEGREAKKKETEDKLACAKRAEKVREELREEKESVELLKNLEDEKKVMEQEFKKAQKKEQEKEKECSNHLARKSDNEKNREKITIYSGKKETYEKIDTIRKNLAISMEKSEIASKEAQDAYLVAEAAKREEENSLKVYEKKEKEYSQMLTLYLQGISGELAKDLKDGEPCPVCGSKEHPKKAVSSESAVSKEALEKKEKEKEKCQKAWKSAEKESSEKDELLKKAQRLEQDAFKKAQELMAEEKVLKDNLCDNISSLVELMAEIDALGKKVKAYDDKLLELEKEQKDAEKERVHFEEALLVKDKEIKKAKERVTEAERVLHKKMKEEGFSSKEEAFKSLIDNSIQLKWSEAVVAFEEQKRNINEQILVLQEKLKGEEEIKEKDILKELQNIETAKEEYIKDETLKKENLKKKKEVLKEVESAMPALEKQLMECEEELAFAKKLRGDQSIGLHYYVLAIMFSSVIRAANEELLKVHGGRYRLRRTEKDERGRKGGLGLEVIDMMADDGKARAVSTLSGGEKFLTALSLALGLSAVARTGGITIEAMFIDEGFGTLDSESISDAMEILASVQKSHGIVGIISHVQALADNISSKLIINKGTSGSTIKKSIG